MFEFFFMAVQHAIILTMRGKLDRVYLDYAATTPVDPRVIETMLPCFLDQFGNPSSAHFYGQQAEEIVQSARYKLLELCNGKGYELFFTSGGSESDNLAIRGVAFAEKAKRGANKILISSVEHHAVLETARQMQEIHGFITQELRVDNYGFVDLNQLEKSLTEDVALVSIILANNEIGTINNVRVISDICHQRGVPFHTDAVQAAAHQLLDLQEMQVDLLSIGAHKFYGPKGVGALIKKKDLILTPQITGGAQENHLRAGTENVPYIRGMVRALECVREDLNAENDRLIVLRDELINGVVSLVKGARLTGHPEKRLPNHASFVIEGVNGNDLLIALDMAGFAVSSGSACKVGNPKPSEVLLALGIAPELALGSLRISLGRATKDEDVYKLLEVMPAIIGKLRNGFIK